jgi:hypothetical protein
MACLAVTADRCNGNPAKLRKLDRERFVAAVRRELPRFGAQRVCHKVADRFFDALVDGRCVAAQRRGALERVGLLMDEWRSALARLREVEARMVAVLDGLELTALVTSIPGLCAVGAAVILAETGDRSRSPPRAAWSSTPGSTRPRTPLGQLPRPDPGQPPRPARPARRRLAGVYRARFPTTGYWYRVHRARFTH